DWQEATGRSRGLVNYGHIAEAAWFVASVAAFTGDRHHADFARSILGYALRRGWDRRHGGLHSDGHSRGDVAHTPQAVWMQAEMLGALSFAYRLTGDMLYHDWLGDQAQFVHRHQRDPRDGEWYSSVYADGTVRDGRKGSPSKAAYHVAQGLFHADRNLAAA